MKTSHIKLVYFSATYTTRTIVRQIANQFNYNITEYDITQTVFNDDIILDDKDLLIVGVPVYSGRIPTRAAEGLTKFKGNNTPTIITCIYGNRDYDDALLELKDIVENNNFKVISAAAFIAQHSIFPKVGTNRPDENDMELVNQFAQKSKKILELTTDLDSLPEIQVKGNYPYKTPGNIPLKPKGNRKCNKCGTCVKLCPVEAISANNPRKTDKEKCIACGRCIVVCSKEARHFGGLIYKIAGRKFVKAYSAPKEAEVMYSRTVN